MPTVKRKPGTTLTPRERSLATHWRIVKAAYTLFCERGYAGTTMVAVAKEAGVAVQTVYFAFHTKSALLSRTIDYAVMGESEPRIPERQPWYQQMRAEPDITRAVRHFVIGAGEIVSRVAPLNLVALASGDPEVVSVVARHDEEQADAYRAVVAILRRKASLRAGVSVTRATQLLLLYLGVEVYGALVNKLGWSHDDWVDWTVATIVEQVFANEP
jgi:AcrR family transcriptional regulator